MGLRSIAAGTSAATAVLLAFCTFLYAQSGPSPEQVARRAIEQVRNEGKFDGAPILAPQTTLHYRGRATTMTPEEALAIVRSWRAGFPDFHFRIEDVIVQGNTVAMRVPFTGTHQGRFWGLEPTGKKIDVTETLIFRIEDGLIAEMWEDFDEYGMRLQLGLIKP
jgi:predicted ester cyclase